MDGIEVFFRLFYYISIYPLVLVCKGIIWGIKQLYGRSRAKEIQATNTAVAQRHGDTRRQQLDDIKAKLLAAMPTTPAEKMRATITLNEITVPEITNSYDHYGTTMSDTGRTKTIYSVDMALELSETERALVRANRIDLIELENAPRYSADELSSMRYEHQKEVDAISAVKDPYYKAAAESGLKLSEEMAKEDRSITTVGDLFVIPFRREFKSAHEAKLYSDRLKTQLLPQLRKLIDTYTDFKPAETVEF